MWLLFTANLNGLEPAFVLALTNVACPSACSACRVFDHKHVPGQSGAWDEQAWCRHANTLQTLYMSLVM